MTRAIVGALAAGPRALTDLAQNPGPAGGLLRNILTLCAAGDILPAEPGRAAVKALNRAVFGRLDGPEEIRWLTLPCGTALEVDRGLLRLLRDGAKIGDDRFPGWREFLASHGL
jgi:hypothetical protein